MPRPPFLGGLAMTELNYLPTDLICHCEPRQRRSNPPIAINSENSNGDYVFSTAFEHSGFSWTCGLTSPLSETSRSFDNGRLPRPGKPTGRGRGFARPFPGGLAMRELNYLTTNLICHCEPRQRRSNLPIAINSEASKSDDVFSPAFVRSGFSWTRELTSPLSETFRSFDNGRLPRPGKPTGRGRGFVRPFPGGLAMTSCILLRSGYWVYFFLGVWVCSAAGFDACSVLS